MATKNNIQLVGHVGQDAKYLNTINGGHILNFSLATKESYTGDNGQRVEQTDWHECVVFGKYAEVLKEKIRKGFLCFVEGKLKYRTYVNKENREIRVAEIIVNSVLLFTLENKES